MAGRPEPLTLHPGLPFAHPGEPELIRSPAGDHAQHGARLPERRDLSLWVGTYEDPYGARRAVPGALLTSHAGFYSSIELLPDDTFMVTAYIKYRPGAVAGQFEIGRTTRPARRWMPLLPLPGGLTGMANRRKSMHGRRLLAGIRTSHVSLSRYPEV